MEAENSALRKELEDKNNQLKEGLENIAIRMKSRRESFEENLRELKDFEAKKVSEEKRQRKEEKKKSRKEKKRLLKAAFKHTHLPEASESVIGHLFESDTADNILDDEEQVECTLCAETIEDYVPKYFSGLLLNPACEKCEGEGSNDFKNKHVQSDKNANIKNDQGNKIPDLETSLNSDSFQLSPTSTTSASLSTEISISSVDESAPSSSLQKKLWKCKYCPQTYPMGYTCNVTKSSTVLNIKSKAKQTNFKVFYRCSCV